MSERSIEIDVHGQKIGGGGGLCLIAGPCVIESREHTLSLANKERSYWRNANERIPFNKQI